MNLAPFGWSRPVMMMALALPLMALSACGGQAVTSPDNAGGSASQAGAGGVGGGSGGSGGASSTGGIGGGSVGGSGGDPAPVDAGAPMCFDNSGCAPDQWCNFEPAGPGMCSTGGKAGTCETRPLLSDCPDYDHCPGVCGCDGQWFCDACEAHVQGVQITEDNVWCTDAGSGAPCGGEMGALCLPDEWCDYPAGVVCGYADDMGVCRSRPQGCTADCPGVCGCDGTFYCNECTANAMGVDITGGLECMGGGEGTTCTTDAQCNPSLRCCYPCGVPGCTNECMQPDANGQCPMFP